MFLSHAVLMLTIISPTQTILDYEIYEDGMYCESVATEITNYNKEYNEKNAPYGVYCRCVQSSTDIADI